MIRPKGNDSDGFAARLDADMKNRKQRRAEKRLRRTAPANKMDFAQAYQTGLDHHRHGRLDEAAGCYRAVLKAEPGHGGALFHLGLVRKAEGKLAEAANLFEKVIEADPTHAKALNNLGLILKAQGHWGEAVEACRKAVKSDPAYVNALNNMGNALQLLDRLGEAEAAYRRALSLAPGEAKIHGNLGVALQLLERPDEAVECFKTSFSLDPNQANVLASLGNTYQDMDRLEEAVEYFEQALAINPDLPAIHNNLGNALQELGAFEEALASYDRAIALKADYAEPINNQGNTLLQMRRFGDAIAAYRKALRTDPGYVKARSTLIFILDMDEETTNDDLQAERRGWNDAYVSPLAKERKPHANTPNPEKRLRIGYVSADFRRHSAAYIFGLPLIHYDRSAFDVICYSNCDGKDDMTARFRDSVTDWRNIATITDGEAAERIRADGIDILVDLSGHTRGNRLFIFARKPAPIQITAWGHAIGTGLETMDYLFSDPVFIPPEDRKYCREEIIDLPCAVGYLYPKDAPPLTPLPMLTSGRVTFGCFNNIGKVSDGAMDIWCDLLHAVPGASLVLKDGRLNSPWLRDAVRGELTRRGIGPDRFTLMGGTSWAEHVGAYDRIDIALCPFPLSGGTTTLEGFLMGVPSVTLRGKTLNGRGTASMNTVLGLADWIAETPADYIGIGKEKAADAEGLTRLRADLRSRLTASPLCDPDLYVGAVETAYRTLWRRWCRDQA